LNEKAHEASEDLFGTLAVVMEAAIFLYMGFTTFTGQFQNWDTTFSLFAILFCLFARVMNIFPLSFLANQCRRHGENYIPIKMQAVMWFAGLRGAIAFALAEDMPGPNHDTYASVTLSIVFFTTVVCGGFTEKTLQLAGMKKGSFNEADLI
jgi:sodium/hydrogen exchanger 8